MSKKQQNKRRRNPYVKSPKFTKKGKVKMNQRFNVGQKVKLTVSQSDLGYQGLTSLDWYGTIVEILRVTKMSQEYNYLVRFPAGNRRWIPERALSKIGSCPAKETKNKSNNVKLLVTVKTDCWGYRFTVSTKRASDHPGWLTTINHQAYNGGTAITTSFCYTDERAKVMHDKWVKILACGPLPDSVEEAGLGEWKRGAVNHMRSAMYKAIPLA